ncbi:hypothetical protein FKP32DRAFT_1672158 [Trametes sanguinea]|nr:hypothetical protein FKP32DRAFT_1672158 [Trametes sanguinea]
MAFIRAPLSAAGCPRRGDPQRFTHLYNFHLGPTGRESLARVTLPVISATIAFEVPGVVAPWEFGQHLDTFLLGNATVTTNGRVRLGHGIFLFEDATEILPATGLPPPPGSSPPPPSPVAIYTTPPRSPSGSPTGADDQGNTYVVGSILHASAAQPSLPPDLPAKPCSPLTSDSLEKLVSVSPRTVRTQRVNGWTTIVEEPMSEDAHEEEKDGDGNAPEVEAARTGSPTAEAPHTGNPPATPEDPSPNVSPLSTPPPTSGDETAALETAAETPSGPYNLRPRPRAPRTVSRDPSASRSNEENTPPWRRSARPLSPRPPGRRTRWA